MDNEASESVIEHRVDTQRSTRGPKAVKAPEVSPVPAYPKNEINVLRHLKQIQAVLHGGLFPGVLSAQAQAGIQFINQCILDHQAILKNHPNLADFEHLL